MDWLVYWFMFPACIVIAAVPTFGGISGAALITPMFLIGFPVCEYVPCPRLRRSDHRCFWKLWDFWTAV